MEYVHETFGKRNRIERWFRELKDRTKRLYNNMNTNDQEHRGVSKCNSSDPQLTPKIYQRRCNT